ncbi:MAG: hypothetical protein HQK53_13895 [Oligoflexia bacterium]|nr:hypothetical protein [Oligoflexia bacterium]
MNRKIQTFGDGDSFKFYNFKCLFSLRVPFSPYLEIVSIIYITIPNLIFFLTWTRPLIAYPVSLLILAATVQVVRRLWREKGAVTNAVPATISIPMLLTYILGLTIWVYISGIGGFFYQNGDYLKHNTLLYDLAHSDWPVTYVGSISEKVYPLVYYLAYYLPPALIEKYINLATSEWFLLDWSILGVLLSLLWLAKLSKKATISTLVFMIFFSGQDFIGHWIFKGQIPLDWAEHLEWWAGLWSFSSNTTMLFWVPHQMIPGWLITAYILDQVFEKREVSDLFYVSSLSIMWSCFVALGLLPYVLVAAVLFYKRSIFSFANIISFLLLVPILGFYFLSTNPYQAGAWFINFIPLLKFLTLAVVFIFLEIGVYFLFVPKVFSDWRSLLHERIYIPLSFVLVFAVLFYRFGEFNDFAMRVSIPPTIILIIVLWRHIPPLRIWYRTVWCYLFIILFGLGAICPIHEMYRSIKNSNFVIPYYSIVFHGRRYVHLMAQYFGKNDTFFYKHVVKPVNAGYRRERDLTAKNYHYSDFQGSGDKIQILPPDVDRSLDLFWQSRSKR